MFLQVNPRTHDMNQTSEQDDHLQRMVEELQLERERNKTLQEELDRVTASCRKDRRRYEADIVTVRQQVKNVQDEVVKLHSLANSLPEAKPVETEVPKEIPAKKRSSTLRGVQHFLGLRKPQR